MSRARPAEDAIAETLASAPFIRVVAASDGDSLAAAGLLARACEQRATPFQLRLGDAGSAMEDAVTVTAGPVEGEGDLGLSRPASPSAYAAAESLGTSPDPVLTLAGTLAAGERVEAAEDVLEAAVAADQVQRHPGVAIPTDDYPVGLAASTRLHAPFSGDESAAAALVAELGADEAGDDAADRAGAAGDDAANRAGAAGDDDTGDAVGRRLASLVAIDTVTADGATARAAERVERVLRPYATPDGPFATLGGHADVLDAVARTAPGAGIPLVLGRRSVGDESARERALEAWRRHGETVHRRIREADTARHHGLSVVRVPGADPATLPAVARLVRDFRSPEPVVLAVADGAAAAATTAAGDVVDMGESIATVADAVGGTGHGTERTGTARFDTETTQFTDAFREAL